LWRSLEYNIRPGETELLADFGAGNILTMIRGVLIAGLSGFLFQPWPSGWLAWAPGVLFTAACLSDHLDGYLARATNHATRMGEILDMSFDGLGILVAAVLAVQYGRVPVWYLLVAAARYLFLLGIWLRRRRGLPVVNLPPSIRRRAFAGIQMGFLFFILLPFFSPSHTHIAAFVFAAPFLIGFLVDWLTVSGHRLGESSIPLSNRWKWTNTALNWLPAGLRSIAALLITGQITIWFQTGISYAPVAAYFIGLAQVLVLVFLLLGASGRISAIAGLVLLGLQQMSANLTPTQIALIMLYTAILYLGTGPLSLWKPEDRWIYRRAGERPE
jgi:CDP-diacylglycerol--glycerol-3-phosphate 3-phosphatidyltransferase